MKWPNSKHRVGKIEGRHPTSDLCLHMWLPLLLFEILSYVSLKKKKNHLINFGLGSKEFRAISEMAPGIILLSFVLFRYVKYF